MRTLGVLVVTLAASVSQGETRIVHVDGPRIRLTDLLGDSADGVDLGPAAAPGKSPHDFQQPSWVVDGWSVAGLVARDHAQPAARLS